MILPNRKDALHKAMMYRMLIGILDEKNLANSLYFKGGTCATMLGFLDRFSIDLDFDLKKGVDKKEERGVLIKVFGKLEFSIKEESKQELFFVLKYEAPPEMRNTLKVGIVDNPPQANVYQPLYLPDISRYAMCQTKESMFANKLVAITDRYNKYKTIAGRDIYDIHYFFLQGFEYNRKVIEERTGKKTKEYMRYLIDFIEEKITEKYLREDLNTLLSQIKYNAVIKSLKIETVSFLKQELKSL